MYFHFIKHRKLFYVISGALAAASIIAIAVFGLNLGIEFTGGSIFEIGYNSAPPLTSEIKTGLADLDLGNLTIQKSGEQGIILKMKEISDEARRQVSEIMNQLGDVQEGTESFQLIGAVIGKELERKTKIVVVISLLIILVYIAFSFRRVARPVRSHIFGFTSLIALCHDVLIPLGVFAALGRFYGIQITVPIITAFLTVFGYSINDSVVVFDRVRENLAKLNLPSFDAVVETSLNQSLRRSVHTSLTTLIALFAIFFFGGASLKSFALALILGISAGAYSSLFLATPLLASYLRFKERKYKK